MSPTNSWVKESSSQYLIYLDIISNRQPCNKFLHIEKNLIFVACKKVTTEWYDFPNVKSNKMLSFPFFSRGLRPDLPSPFGRKFLFCSLIQTLMEEWVHNINVCFHIILGEPYGFQTDLKKCRDHTKCTNFAVE